MQNEQRDKSKPMRSNEKLRHVVLFGYKMGTSDTQIDTITQRFVALQELVPGIETLEWGVNSSPEGLNRGASHCFTLTFASDAARDAYLPHPAHTAFAEWVGTWIESVTVVDYWVQTEPPAA